MSTWAGVGLDGGCFAGTTAGCLRAEQPGNTSILQAFQQRGWTSQVRQLYTRPKGESLGMSSRSTTAFPEVEDDTASKVQPLYHVILLNDEDHTYDYVIEMLLLIFCLRFVGERSAN
jgi:hypothetical protein